MNRTWLQKNRIWLMLWAAGAAVFLLVTGNQFISYDEAYTLQLIRHPFADIIRITGLDVHPPLYYLLVKCFAAPFGYAVTAVKAVNLLPLFGMMVLGRGIVRKIWGEQAGLWFTFLAVFLPANQTYLLPEMRMYGLASFSVVCCILAEQLLIREREDVLSHRMTWILFAASGLAAAYTQYYALIAVILIYLVFAGTMLSRKKKLWKGWGICVLVSIVSYLPWLAVLLGQLRTVGEGYWIPPITIRSIISYLAFPLYSCMKAGTGAALAVILVLILLLGGAWKILRQEKELIVPSACVYLGMIAAGVLVSLAVRPLFSVRYVKCVLGILVLAAACVLCSMKRSWQRALAVVFCIFAAANAAAIVRQNVQNNQTYAEMKEYAAEHLEEDSVILYREDEHTMGVFSYLMGEWKQVITDDFDKDEYEAFAPVLSERTAYEAKYGSLLDKDLWVIDEGNMQYDGTWDYETWNVSEMSPLYYYKDASDVMQYAFTHITPKK